MRSRSREICLLTAEGRRERRGTAIVPEVIPALFLLSGILFACRDMMYESACLAGAILTGALVILILRVSELSAGAARVAKLGIYVVSLLSFLVFILYIAQGFLDTVNRVMALWNLRFQTELEQFSVNSRAAAGALVFWCLLAVPLASFLLVLVRKRRTGLICLLAAGGLLAGFVLGRSQMWESVVCLFAGILGTLTVTSAPGRQYGLRGMVCILAAAAMFLGFFLATGGYEGIRGLARLRAGVVTWFEEFRYGKDTLPVGNLAKAPGLLEGESETLKLEMEKDQEWYLKGFVGAEYNGTAWKNLSPGAYQGEYVGLLKWLENKGFSVLTQFARYNALTETAQGSDTGSVKVDVENVGAYRKFVYLPSTAQGWEGGGAEAGKDWQVRSNRFFGADEYRFQAVSGAATADGVSTASWMQDPSGKEEKEYLDAESVYHSFAEEYYMQVDEELKAEMEELFFPEYQGMEYMGTAAKELDFNEVTAQIRKVLRRETRYEETPPAVPEGEDFVEWFLNESRRGNAVHYASAAVMAYRTAGYPARYVEGYHYAQDVEGERAEQSASETAEGERAEQSASEAGESAGTEESTSESAEGKTTAVLTSKNAHAWAEVYVSGIGWMPVEVVPGMYTEMYTNQIVEGEPSFQVNADPGDDGLEIEGGSADGDDQEEETAQTPLPLRRILALVMLGLYLCLALCLALEGQRIVRRICRKRAVRKAAGTVFVDRYVEEIRRLLLTGKVKGNYNHPLELAEQVEERFDGISKEEYVRAVNLLQKVRFGGKRLKPYELHTLECFQERLAVSLSRQSRIWGRCKVRYWYVL